MELLNNFNDQKLKDALFRCCGSQNWVDGMLAERPFGSPNDLHAKAKQVYATLETADYLEAFSHHPRIGGDLDKLREKFAPTATWSGNEQASVKQASEEVLQRLASGNDAYYEKFGYIFIVCATGKSAQEMLDLLEARLPNDPAEEIKIAAGEQEKIMGLRLDKFLTEILEVQIDDFDGKPEIAFLTTPSGPAFELTKLLLIRSGFTFVTIEPSDFSIQDCFSIVNQHTPKLILWAKINFNPSVAGFKKNYADLLSKHDIKNVIIYGPSDYSDWFGEGHRSWFRIDEFFSKPLVPSEFMGRLQDLLEQSSET